MGDRKVDRSVVYRDVFGDWRWEYRDVQGRMRDSAQGYYSSEECERACAAAARAEAQTGVDAPAAPVHDGRVPPRVILCVQPAAEARQALESKLADYQIVFAVTALEAIRSLNSSIFDAYVLDYWLPDWSGVQLCREIRKVDPHGPICFFSTAAGESHRARARRAGASAYVTVSEDPQAIATRLRTLFAATDVESLRAKIEEERAIQAELTRRARAAIERTEKARTLAAEATQRAARAKALHAFIVSGGTQANFNRWWPNVFGSVRANLL